MLTKLTTWFKTLREHRDEARAIMQASRENPDEHGHAHSHFDWMTHRHEHVHSDHDHDHAHGPDHPHT